MKHKHLLNLACLPVLFLGLTSMSQAQTTTAPATPAATPDKKDGKRGERLDKMKEELGLTDDQLAKLKPIFEAEKQDLSALKENTALSKEDKMSQMKAIREKYKPQIDAILTPEQQEKMKAAREQRHDEKKNSSGTTPPAT